MKHYGERDIMQLDADGNFYATHVQAMTAEGLFSKSDIAAELAWRDKINHDLKAENKRLRDRLAEHDGCSRWGVRDAIAMKKEEKKEVSP